MSSTTSENFPFGHVLITISETTAQESNAIVSQLFPANVRDRLFRKKGKKEKRETKKKGYEPTKAKMRNFLSDGSTDGGDMDMMMDPDTDDRPIADLFPETTVMFGDIAGFTAVRLA